VICRSVWLSVGLSVTVVSLSKTAQPIEMPFGLWAWISSRNHALNGVHIPLCKGTILGGKDVPGHARTARRHSAVSYARMAEAIEMSFGLWTRVGQRKHLLHGAHSRTLANTTEPSVYGGDAVVCLITLTTYYYYRPSSAFCRSVCLSQ